MVPTDEMGMSHAEALVSRTFQVSWHRKRFWGVNVVNFRVPLETDETCPSGLEIMRMGSANCLVFSGDLEATASKASQSA